MLPVNATRPASAAAEREPRTIDRLSGTIKISPTTSSEPVATARDDRAAYLLAELRCVALRARLVACAAVAWLRDCGLLEHVTPPNGVAL